MEDPFLHLKEARKFALENKIEVEREEDDLGETLRNELTSDFNHTISLFYIEEKREAVLLIKGKTPKLIRKHCSPDDYLEVCATLEIEENNDYNLSRNLIVDNVYVRVFALTRPVSNYPNITISTAKEPPLDWDQIEVRDILLDVVKENFLLVGASGAGKTYLMNYMLKNIHKGTYNKIGIIEEFSELFAPNESTSKIVVPTPKPNEPRILQFLAEQSNLMRLDYLYIGEIKGEEAWPFIANLSSGTKGGATIHGNSARQGLNRLKYLCLMTKVPEKVIDEAIAKSVTYVIYVEKQKIREIQRLVGNAMSGNFSMQEIWKMN